MCHHLQAGNPSIDAIDYIIDRLENAVKKNIGVPPFSIWGTPRQERLGRERNLFLWVIVGLSRPHIWRPDQQIDKGDRNDRHDDQYLIHAFTPPAGKNIVYYIRTVVI